MPRFTTQS